MSTKLTTIEIKGDGELSLLSVEDLRLRAIESLHTDIGKYTGLEKLAELVHLSEIYVKLSNLIKTRKDPEIISFKSFEELANRTLMHVVLKLMDNIGRTFD